MTDRSRQTDLQQKMWRTYRTELLAFVRRRLSDDAAAEDVVQDVLAKAYAELGRLKDETRLRSWLYQITRNALADHYRKVRPTRDVPGEWADDQEAHPETVEEELVRCLAPMIERLPAAYREAVVLSELKGERQKNVAGLLGLSLSGAKSRVQRGRGLLRDMVAACCDVTLDVRGHPMDHQCKQHCGCC